MQLYFFILGRYGNPVKEHNPSFNLANRLNKQRLKAPECCDAFLKVNGTVLGTHRCVLAATLSYFHTLFYGAFRKNEQAEVDLSEILTSPAILKKIVDFFYGQKIYVTDNISDYHTILFNKYSSKDSSQCMLYLDLDGIIMVCILTSTNLTVIP